jgi:4-amino-4-deoxy-L-arabinose transferase-like glycosyltransferase
MTIDPLSVFFWAWGANLFLDALQKNRGFDWALAGFAVGCGFLAKFVNALQLVAFLLFLAWSPGQRRHLKNPKI